MYYLLKTFSIDAFQGQYPNMAVRMTTSPIGPRIHRKTPEVKKAMVINIIPIIKRIIPSPFPTFFAFTVLFSSCSPNYGQPSAQLSTCCFPIAGFCLLLSAFCLPLSAMVTQRSPFPPNSLTIRDLTCIFRSLFIVEA